MQQPLVSIIVATYNSAQFVIETLESAKAQSWKNIELIVSDDYSKDNTVELCSNWLNQHKDRFVRTDLITVSKNTGVSANCNRCIKASNAAWIKLIAGDDILLPNCIEDNMQFVNSNQGANVIFSQVKLYNDTFERHNYFNTSPTDFPDNLMDPHFSANDQFLLLLVSDRIQYTPSYFFNKQAILNVGCYDENNFLVEDYPMWLKLTKNGERLYYFHIPTVGYRIHSNALNNTGNSVLFKPSLLRSFSVRRKYAHPYLPWEIVFSEWFVQGVARLFILLKLNRNTKLLKQLFKLLTIFLNPFQYIYAIKKRLEVNAGKFYYK